MKRRRRNFKSISYVTYVRDLIRLNKNFVFCIESWVKWQTRSEFCLDVEYIQLKSQPRTLFSCVWINRKGTRRAGEELGELQLSAQWPGLWMTARLEVTLLWHRPGCFCKVNKVVLKKTGLHLDEKSGNSCIRGRSPPASLTFTGQATRHTAVNHMWHIKNIVLRRRDEDILTLTDLILHSLRSKRSRTKSFSAFPRSPHHPLLRHLFVLAPIIYARPECGNGLRTGTLATQAKSFTASKRLHCKLMINNSGVKQHLKP